MATKNKQREIVRRSFHIETRDIGQDGDGGSIVGYAAVFNQIEHGEVIRPGAFTKTLGEQKDIKAYWSHDASGSRVLARTSNGTLTLQEDETGLRVRLRPNPETSWGKDALASVARGDVDQMSFGFSPIKMNQEIIDGETINIVREVRLYEVSLVSEPWYSGTSAGVRDQSGQTNDAEDDAPESPCGHSTPKRSVAEYKLRTLKLKRSL
jgi:HK97 family phage prohead protease